MKLLFLSLYFPPDLSAGSFRATALVKALLTARPDLEIEVITTLPNRYFSYSSDASPLEQHDRLTIRRIQMRSHQSGMLDQIRAYFHFAWDVWKLTRGHSYDLVFATSSRLMTAVLGSLLSRYFRAPLYLDIRDIFVDTIKDMLPRFAPAAKPIFGAVERFAIRRAASVNLVSRGFAPYFEARYPGQRFTYFTNGVDEEFAQLDLPSLDDDGKRPLRVLYAGNIGEGQGLHQIIPGLAVAMGGHVQFRILGDGGRRAALEQEMERHAGSAAIQVLPPVGRDALIAEYAAADVLFLHLNNYDAFLKVLPSKLFEYAATGKPIWAGIAGHSAAFGAQEIENFAVFAPCDIAGAKAAFAQLKIGKTDRSGFISKYGRSQIAREMAHDIVQFASR